MPLRVRLSTLRPGKPLLTPIACTLVMAGCLTVPTLPPNAKTVPGAYGAPVLDTVDFSAPAPTAGFSALKLCVAETVTLPDVQLRDASGSFVGAATGRYYRSENRQTVAGGSVFKLVDEGSSTLVASGLARATAQTGGLVVDLVRFDLRATYKPSGVQLVFLNITRAMQNTGSAANDGFAPVFVSAGSRSDVVYAALEQAGSKLRSCLSRQG